MFIFYSLYFYCYFISLKVYYVSCSAYIVIVTGASQMILDDDDNTFNVTTNNGPLSYFNNLWIHLNLFLDNDTW